MTDSLTEAFYRRIRAFDLGDLEEFYDPNQPRDKEGQWTKVWSGVSAHPDRRVQPEVAPITIKRLRQSPDNIVRKIYDADLGNGFSAKVDDYEGIEVHAGDGYVEVYINGSITSKSGLKVGYFKRHLFTDDDGKLVADHQELFLDPQYQGRGLADRFNAHAISAYQKYGVDRIELEAAADVGGYAWARQGFRFKGDDSERREFLNRQLKRMETKINIRSLDEHRPRLMREIKALRKAIEAGEDVQPIHIASIGESYARYTSRDIQFATPRDYETWPGKEVLLGTQWWGTYYFDATKAISAAATSLEHAALRPAYRTAVAIEMNTPCIHGEFACYEASCRPPTSGGTGGSSKKRGGSLSLTEDWTDDQKLLDTGPSDRLPGSFAGGGASPWYAVGVPATDIYNGFESFKGPNGETVRVTKVTPTQYNVVSVTGVIKSSDGTDIGEFSRSYRKKGNEPLTVHHESLTIDPKYQGSGLGGAFLRHTVEHYKSQGVTAITLVAANGSDPKTGVTYNGAYTWARLGFELRPNRQLNEEWKAAAGAVLGREVKSVAEVVADPRGVEWLKSGDPSAVWEGMVEL